jgi:hypothetical protein
LLANAVYQPKSMTQTHRLRGQARSYTGFALAHTSRQNPGPVGAGLLANALYQPKTMTQTHRLRGQARSYTGFCIGRYLCVRRIILGSSIKEAAITRCLETANGRENVVPAVRFAHHQRLRGPSPEHANPPRPLIRTTPGASPCRNNPGRY